MAVGAMPSHAGILPEHPPEEWELSVSYSEPYPAMRLGLPGTTIRVKNGDEVYVYHEPVVAASRSHKEKSAPLALELYKAAKEALDSFSVGGSPKATGPHNERHRLDISFSFESGRIDVSLEFGESEALSPAIRALIPIVKSLRAKCKEDQEH